MNEIHDINGVSELGDFRWHGVLPCRRRRRIGAGAASGGAVSTQVLARRQGRDSPQLSWHTLQNIYVGSAQAKLIILMSESKNTNE
jgi:hypothetical protein